jgi:outer membrane protein OmpA-like peptidoglycan-associated protein
MTARESRRAEPALERAIRSARGDTMKLRLGTWALAGVLAAAIAQAQSSAPGVTDYSGSNAAKIQVSDITTALAVPRGTRIEASAPPTIRLPIFFEFNSAKLRPDANELLDKVSAALKSGELETFRFSIEGHTDGIGSEAYNKDLSSKRAEAVENYLLAKGVPRDRLGTIGHGKSEPVASNDTEEGRQRNRRVEIINLGATN